MNFIFRHADDPGPGKGPHHYWPGVFFQGRLKDAVEERRTTTGTPAGLVGCVQQLAKHVTGDDGLRIKETVVLVPEFFRHPCRAYHMPAVLFLWHRPGGVGGSIVFEDDVEAVQLAAKAFRAQVQ